MPPLKGGQTNDFSGGPNLRDAPSQLGVERDVDAWNVTFDERGGVSSRLGYAKYNSAVYDAAASSRTSTGRRCSPSDRAGRREAVQGHVDVSVKTFTTSGARHVHRAQLARVACHPSTVCSRRPTGDVDGGR
jgi:hypothetical protein